MKIALIGTSAPHVFLFRFELIKDLVTRGHEVYVFATDFNPSERKKITDVGAFPMDYDFNRTGLNPLNDLLNTLKLAQALKKLAPDLVFSYFVKPLVFGTLAAKIAGVKRRLGMLEGLGYAFIDRPVRPAMKVVLLRRIQVLLYRLVMPLMERIIFLNPDDPRDLVERYKIKTHRVSVLGGIGLNLDQYTYTKPDLKEFSFIFVGRLLAEKGIHEYVAAARSVRRQYPDVKFYVLGGLDEANPGGLNKAELDSLVQEGVISYPGHVTNVCDWLARSSVFVLPSYREGVPRSTQEAMAVGRPVITTDVPGCRETVESGVNGFLVEPWSTTALTEKMIYFLQNPDQVEVMGLQSLRLAQEKFDVSKVNVKLIEYFS